MPALSAAPPSSRVHGLAITITIFEHLFSPWPACCDCISILCKNTRTTFVARGKWIGTSERTGMLRVICENAQIRVYAA